MADLHIGIAGNIGAGKSTLAKKMSTKPLDQIILDVLRNNNVAERKVIALEEENQTIKQENEDLKFQMALLRSELMTIKAHLGI